MNTNTQHTPGPWYYWNGEIHANYPNQNGPFVAQLMCLGDRETAANGRLIAAAHAFGRVDEGGCAKMLGIGIVEFRGLSDGLINQGGEEWDRYRKEKPPHVEIRP